MLIIGIIVRLVVGFFMTYVFDMQHWGVVVQNINSGSGLYEITGYFYTPVWGYILGMGSFLQDIIGIDLIGARLTEMLSIEEVEYFVATYTTPAFNMGIKILYLISDIVVGYLIFWLIRDYTGNHKKAVLGFALWFLCPLVISVGFIIGMFDTIVALMTLLSVIMLRKGRYMEAGALLALASLTKFFPAFLAPVFIAYIISKHLADDTAKKNTAFFIIGAAVMSIIILLPQMLDGTFADCFLFITSRISNGMGSSIVGTIGGYVAVVAYALALLIAVLYAKKLIKLENKGDLDKKMLDAMFVIVTILFIYPPLPQYILLLLPFLIFMAVSNKRYMLPLILLMIGTTLATAQGGPIDLVAIGAFTDILSLDSLLPMIDAYTTPIFGIPLIKIVGGIGLVIQYAGILTILWIRFEDDIRKFIAKRKNAAEI